MEEQKKTRSERNAELKAQYLAEQARKRDEKEAKKAAKEEARAAKKRGDSETQKEEASTGVAPSKVVEHDLMGTVTTEPTRERKAERKAAAKAEKEVAKVEARAVKNSGRKGALPAEVHRMLVEKKLILAKWRSRKVTPEKAVEELTALTATDQTGAVWRLLPRSGGAGLIKTNPDGTTEIVEPPMKKRPVVGVVVLLLFALLAGAAIWSSFSPETDSGSGNEVVATTTTP